ncbi:cytochrome D1 domain-containing protein [Nocardia sp. NPDC049149]|uniref:cytochrome D1 domain-containing protein n=1 Tax=Nocardia sp. NPDC049149 TaxID=3364315 RepID=UPI0037155B69
MCLLVTVGMMSPINGAANPAIPGSASGPDGPIWVPNFGTGAVAAVDPATMQLVSEIPNVGDHPMVIKELPDHSRLFVGNFGPLTWNVSVIDTATRSVIARIPTIGAAYEVIQLSHDGRYLYVPTSLSVIDVFDTHTLQLARTLPIALPPLPVHVEIAPDDSVLYALTASGQATKYDANTGAMLAPPIFLNGLVPGWGAMSLSGDTIYAVNTHSGVTIIDTKSWSVTRTISLPFDAEPISGTLTPDGSRLWVCDYYTKEILVLDAHTGDILNRIATPSFPVYAGFSPDGHTAYVTVVSDGLKLGFWSPLTDPFQQMIAEQLNLDTSLIAYNVDTGEPGPKLTVKGAFFAGVFPG